MDSRDDGRSRADNRTTVEALPRRAGVAPVTSEGKDRAATVDKVILADAGRARAMGRRYVRSGVSVNHLEQVAYMAWVRAVCAFDGDREEEFLPIAVAVIHSDIKRWLRAHGWEEHPPRPRQYS